MLSLLNVKNFALVDQLEVSFLDGMTVVSGETGAGKSIMLDALGLTLGDRAETGFIGPRADKAEVISSFDLTGNPQATQWLKDRELVHEDTVSECILRRVITREGRSRGFINGTPSTLTDMKSLGELLVDIHSQHEHQSLLRKDTHSQMLDEFAGVVDVNLAANKLFVEHQSVSKQLTRLIESNTEQTARLQLLSYQAEELDKLQYSPGELDKLEAEQKRLANAEHILGNTQDALEMLEGNRTEGAADHLSRAVVLLQQLDLIELKPMIEMLESSRIQLEEATSDLQRFTNDVELDPGRLTEVEDRLSRIYEICRKHRIKPNDIPTLTQDIHKELDTLQNIDAEIEKVEHQIGSIAADFDKLAKKLSTARTKAGKKLTKSVSAQLALLGMMGATFAVELTPHATNTPARNGLEQIEFLISTNPGQTPRSLNKIASGGELSRISLAIQVVTADTSRVPTLMFDEVDVGIGGGIAEVVGHLLRELGTKAQIVCVTHLPQVAAQGHHHLQVTKSSEKKTARTEVNKLGDEQKVQEIARMLGGIEMTDQSLAHALEMYESAQT